MSEWKVDGDEKFDSVRETCFEIRALLRLLVSMHEIPWHPLNSFTRSIFRLLSSTELTSCSL